jgi:hypothetical protein
MVELGGCETEGTGKVQCVYKAETVKACEVSKRGLCLTGTCFGFKDGETAARGSWAVFYGLLYGVWCERELFLKRDERGIAQ